ncbi:MAG: class I tRNA ligase family protein, partial [Acidobacteriota bacterium]
YSCSEGQETRLSLAKFNEIGRRFITKLWNASRFVLLSLERAPDAAVGFSAPAEEDLWIASRCASTVRAVRSALDAFDFGPVGQVLYRFVWNDYCDWFLELSKGRLQGEDPAAARRAAHVLGVTLVDILRLLHPIVPFITEELWGKVLAAMDAKKLWLGARPSSELLILERYPVADAEPGASVPDVSLEDRFESLQRLVSRVRKARADARLPESVRLQVLVKPLSDDFHRLVEATSPVLCRLANLESLTFASQRPPGSVTGVDPRFEMYVGLGRHLDLKVEVARIDKEMAALKKKLDLVSRKLANPKFLAGAPEAVVEGEKAKDRELKEMIGKLEALRAEYAAS